MTTKTTDNKEAIDLVDAVLIKTVTEKCREFITELEQDHNLKEAIISVPIFSEEKQVGILAVGSASKATILRTIDDLLKTIPQDLYKRWLLYKTMSFLDDTQRISDINLANIPTAGEA